MYSFARHPEIRVVDEPFYAHYLNRTGLDHPGREDVLKSQSLDCDEIFAQLNNTASAILYAKNMAHHMRYIPLESFTGWKHFFLIRHPALLIRSFAKVIEQPTLKDIGSIDQTAQFRYLSEIGEDPVVVDSNELLKDPPKVLHKLCEALGIPYSSTMLSWPRGGRPEDGVWAEYWYRGVHQSTGFGEPKDVNVDVPEHCRELLEEALPNYQLLFSHALKA